MMNPGKLQCTMSVQNNIYFPPALVQPGSRQQAAERFSKSQPPGKRGESEKMRLCKKSAEKLVGKKVDSKRRLFGYYPIEIIKINGELYAKDAVGVCSPIPEKEDDFNCFNYDFVVE